MFVNNGTTFRKRKSLFWAYLLWLFGGFMGLHQFYLGRDRHAFAIWISFGGYFGLGLFRDLWRIPEYVADVNEDPKYMASLVASMHRNPKPPFGLIRYFASIVVADILGYLIMGAIPHELLNENYSHLLSSLLVPIGCALGVHLVGNIGRFSGSFKWPLLAAYLTSPLFLLGYNAVFLSSLLALVAFVRYSLCWRRFPNRPKLTCKRFTTICLVTLVYFSLWTSWFYFNCSVTDKNEEQIKCREAVNNFFNSPAWLEFRTVLHQLWRFTLQHGITGLWNEIVEALDPQGEKNALRVLGLTEEGTTQEVITSRYRQLARQWHPDKHHSEEEKKLAQERFMAVQQAYELLSRMKQKRLQKQLA